MRAFELFALADWVENNRSWIMQENPPVKEIRRKAEIELCCKCAESNIKAAMERAEIPVRRSKTESQMMLLRQEKAELEDLVIELWNQANLPKELADSFRHRIEKLGGRVLDVMKRQSVNCEAAGIK